MVDLSAQARSSMLFDLLTSVVARLARKPSSSAVPEVITVCSPPQLTPPPSASFAIPTLHGILTLTVTLREESSTGGLITLSE